MRNTVRRNALFVLFLGTAFWAGCLWGQANSGTSAGLMDTARIKLAQKQPGEAIPYLLKALHNDPQNPEVVNLLGVAYLQNKAAGAALGYFRRAMKLDPEDARFLNNAGSAYHTRKDYKTAVKYYKQALEKQSDYVVALGNLANVYFALKKNLQAIDVLHRIVQINPDYLLKQSEGAFVGVDDLNLAERFFYLAKLYAQAGDKERAILFLQKSLASGLQNTKRLVKDKDFESLANDPRFTTLLGKR